MKNTNFDNLLQWSWEWSRERKLARAATEVLDTCGEEGWEPY